MATSDGGGLKRGGMMRVCCTAWGLMVEKGRSGSMQSLRYAHTKITFS